MLPWAHRIGIADRKRVSTEKARRRQDQSVGGPVAPSDNVARTSGSEADAPFGEETVTPAALTNSAQACCLNKGRDRRAEHPRDSLQSDHHWLAFVSGDRDDRATEGVFRHASSTWPCPSTLVRSIKGIGIRSAHERLRGEMQAISAQLGDDRPWSPLQCQCLQHAGRSSDSAPDQVEHGGVVSGSNARPVKRAPSMSSRTGASSP